MSKSKIGKIIRNLDRLKGRNFGHRDSPSVTAAAQLVRDHAVRLRKVARKMPAQERRAGPAHVQVTRRPAQSFNEVARAMGIAIKKAEPRPADALGVAKLVVEQGAAAASNFTKRDFYLALVRGGEALRKADPGLTAAAAFAKYATETTDGRSLMLARSVANGGELNPDDAEPDAPPLRSDAYRKLSELAAGIQGANPELSPAAAFAEACQRNPHLLAEDNEWSRGFNDATGMRKLHATFLGRPSAMPEFKPYRPPAPASNTRAEVEPESTSLDKPRDGESPYADDAMAALNRLRDRTRRPGELPGAALERAIATPEGRELFARVKAATLKRG